MVFLNHEPVGFFPHVKEAHGVFVGDFVEQLSHQVVGALEVRCQPEWLLFEFLSNGSNYLDI